MKRDYFKYTPYYYLLNLFLFVMFVFSLVIPKDIQYHIYNLLYEGIAKAGILNFVVASVSYILSFIFITRIFKEKRKKKEKI